MRQINIGMEILMANKYGWVYDKFYLNIKVFVLIKILKYEISFKSLSFSLIWNYFESILIEFSLKLGHKMKKAAK